MKDKLTDKQLVDLINRLDPIVVAEHSPGVGHISLIGWPADIFALDIYLMNKTKPDPDQYQDQETGAQPSKLRLKNG